MIREEVVVETMMGVSAQVASIALRPPLVVRPRQTLVKTVPLVGRAGLVVPALVKDVRRALLDDTLIHLESHGRDLTIDVAFVLVENLTPHQVHQRVLCVELANSRRTCQLLDQQVRPSVRLAQQASRQATCDTFATHVPMESQHLGLRHWIIITECMLGNILNVLLILIVPKGKGWMNYQQEASSVSFVKLVNIKINHRLLETLAYVLFS